MPNRENRTRKIQHPVKAIFLEFFFKIKDQPGERKCEANEWRKWAGIGDRQNLQKFEAIGADWLAATAGQCWVMAWLGFVGAFEWCDAAAGWVLFGNWISGLSLISIFISFIFVVLNFYFLLICIAIQLDWSGSTPIQFQSDRIAQISSDPITCYIRIWSDAHP